MPNDRQAVLNALRAELAFVESGAYRDPSHAKWRPQFIFEDSPTCPNRTCMGPRKPCSECVLAKFFPLESRAERLPCRHIPLNQRGETINSLYRTGTAEELESALVGWLEATIQRLECEQAEGLRNQELPVIHVEAKFVSNPVPAPEHSTFSLCANPECRVSFVYGEGCFFRFRQSQDAGNRIPNTHSVQHFWLCGTCSKRLTLEHRDGSGVLVKDRLDIPSEAGLSRYSTS